MTRLILTTESSAVGALQLAGLGDLVIAIERRLVWGPLPSEKEREAFFAVRTLRDDGHHWLDATPAWRIEASGAENAGLIDLCASCEAVELWFDPNPNGQLTLLWLLDFWRAKAAAASTLVVHHVDVTIGDAEPEQLAKINLRAVAITHDHLDAASLAWQAYCAPSPQAWFNLIGAGSNLLPQLAPCALALIEELPAKGTGLGATETRMLELVASGGAHPFDLFPGHHKPNQRRVFDYWEVGALLDGLARCPVPAVSGLDEGPFSLEMHDDPDRLERYKRSRLSLTEFGEAVVGGKQDFRSHNPLHRWWGGTELTTERLWRWDKQTRSLIAP